MNARITTFRAAVACIVAGLAFLAAPAMAQPCASLPNLLTNGTPADATQVMANLTHLLNCINGFPAPTMRRQTVYAGPLTSGGAPSFLQASSVNLSITTQNIASATPLAVTAANYNEANTGAPKNFVGVTTSDLTWSSLAPGTTNYLYVTVAGNGSMTTGATTFAPLYQPAGTPVSTAGQFTFNTTEMKGYLGNGSSAPQAYVVFVGEAVTGSSTVTSTVAYAYNGVYESGWTATLPSGSTLVSRAHNVGLAPSRVNFIVENISADVGYAVGDQISMGSLYTDDAAVNVIPTLSAGRLSMAYLGQAVNCCNVLNKSTGTRVALTLAKWKYKFTADRGW